MSDDYKSNEPIFFVVHPTDKPSGVSLSNTLCKTIPLAGKLSLTYVDQPAFEQAGLKDTDKVGISVVGVEEAPWMGDMLEMPVHLLKLFYHLPIGIHFAGLLFGWSPVADEEGDTLEDGGFTADSSWRNVEEDCWYGEADSVILNIAMPKDGDSACGCGAPGTAVSAIRKILLACLRNPFVTEEDEQNHRKDTFYKAGSDNDQDNYIGGLSYFAAYVLESVGMTEHGSSIGHSWLSEKGFWYTCLIEAYEELESQGK